MNSQTANPVNEKTALSRSAAVYACVDILARSISAMAVSVNRIDDQGFPTPDRKSHLWRLLNVKANPWQSAFEMRELMLRNLVIHGAALARRYTNSLGVTEAIVPFPAGAWSVQWDETGTRLEYEVVYANGNSEVLDRSQVLHIRGPYSDMVTAVSPIQYAAQSMSSDMSLGEHQDQSFGPHAARPGGIVTSPKKLDPETAKNLRKAFNDKWAGQDNAWKTQVLDNGMEWTPVSMSLSDQQFLETRQFSVEQICRIFAVPPEMIQQTVNSSYNQAEQQYLTFANFTLSPLAQRLESQYREQLVINRTEQSRIEFEHDFWALTRGDMNTVSDYLRSLVQGGIFTPNEARGRIGLPRYEDEGADKLYVQQNMASVNDLDDLQESQKGPAPTEEPPTDNTEES